jgi:hypothetical protein
MIRDGSDIVKKWNQREERLDVWACGVHSGSSSDRFNMNCRCKGFRERLRKEWWFVKGTHDTQQFYLPSRCHWVTWHSSWCALLVWTRSYSESHTISCMYIFLPTYTRLLVNIITEMTNFFSTVDICKLRVSCFQIPITWFMMLKTHKQLVAAWVCVAQWKNQPFLSLLSHVSPVHVLLYHCQHILQTYSKHSLQSNRTGPWLSLW